MRLRLPMWLVLFVLPMLLLGSFFVFRTQGVRAIQSDHVVISEVQIDGLSSGDEFVELYNPTETAVDLANFSLRKKTEDGTESDLINPLSGTIPAHGYFLMTSETAAASPAADLIFTEETIASNNTVLLYGSDGSSVIDKVGLGNATDKETTAVGNPASGKSVERKAYATSTSDSMMIGGADEFAGNGWDTDNNTEDFVLRASPQPQSSIDAVEPVAPTPTVEPTVEPTPTEEPTPTVEPTETPEPTVEPTETPEPTMTPEPTPTQTPSNTFSFFNQTCRVVQFPIHFFGRTFYMSHIYCYAW